MIAKIKQLLEEIDTLTASNAEELEALRIKYLSKKGAINDLMADFRNVPADQKKEVGMQLNELKTKAQDKINALKEQFANQDNTACDLDLTRSAYPVKLGTRHPLTIVKNEIIDIFSRLGFSIAEGPEIEDDWHVFSALNFAPEHPARDMQDTFFIEANPDVVLRTHTSSVHVCQTERSRASPTRAARHRPFRRYKCPITLRCNRYPAATRRGLANINKKHLNFTFCNMLTISQKAKVMPSSPIRKLVPYAEAAKKKGITVYHLNIGQPDIESPTEALAS